VHLAVITTPEHIGLQARVMWQNLLLPSWLLCSLNRCIARWRKTCHRNFWL